MNDSTNTTCHEDTCTESLTEGLENTLTTAQPRWHAERTDNGVELEITLPGVARENLDLEVEGRELRLSARRDDAGDAGDARKLILGQPSPDAYALKLRLGESLDGDQLTAALKDGILKVAVPLASEARPRNISID